MARNIIYKLIDPIRQLYWFIFRPKTYGVKCVVEKDGEILLIRNAYSQSQKLWLFPGGGIRRGETAEEAAKREIKEEVGITVKDLKQIGQFESNKEYKKDTIVVFLARSESKDTKLDVNEIAEAKWFLPRQLPPISGYSEKIISMWQKV